MVGLVCKFCAAALLLAFFIAYGTAPLDAAQGRRDRVRKDRADSADPSQSINAKGFGPSICADGEMATVFRGFDNCALIPASIAIVKDALVVSLEPSPESETLSGGVEIDVGVEIERAGDDGFRIDNADTRIPQDVTDYFVELDGYWGTTLSPEPWSTDSIPIGFATANMKITGSANFDVCPIFCSTVEVEFRGGQSPGRIECPSGDLFSVSDSTTVTVRSVVAHGTCRGGGGACNECAARDNAALQFDLAEVVEGWVVDEAVCTVMAGDPPFTASRIRIKPKLADCREEAANPPNCTGIAVGPACSGPDSPTDVARAAGGNTPPMYRLKLLASHAASADQTNAAAIPGSFIILDEAVCDLQEIGAACQDGKDNDCDGYTDCADPDCADNVVACPNGRIPAISTWGLPVLTLATLTAGTVILRRRRAQA